VGSRRRFWLRLAAEVVSMRCANYGDGSSEQEREAVDVRQANFLKSLLL